MFILLLQVLVFAAPLDLTRCYRLSEYLASDSCVVITGEHLGQLERYFKYNSRARVIMISSSTEAVVRDSISWNSRYISLKPDWALSNAKWKDIIHTYRPGTIYISSLIKHRFQKTIKKAKGKPGYKHSPLVLEYLGDVDNGSGSDIYKCEKSEFLHSLYNGLYQKDKGCAFFVAPVPGFTKLKQDNPLPSSIEKSFKDFFTMAHILRQQNIIDTASYFAALQDVHLALDKISRLTVKAGLSDYLNEWKEYRKMLLGELVSSFCGVYVKAVVPGITTDFKSPLALEFEITKLGAVALKNIRVMPVLPAMWSFQAIKPDGFEGLIKGNEIICPVKVNVESHENDVFADKKVVVPIHFLFTVVTPGGGELPFQVSRFVEIVLRAR
ncbi:MAG: hypothetical protein HQK83_11555 [Fibrobacteria bacterium]|nr:hypothetical protein [Fibrobacteria bacterium]